jgi:hypothetical protein
MVYCTDPRSNVDEAPKVEALLQVPPKVQAFLQSSYMYVCMYVCMYACMCIYIYEIYELLPSFCLVPSALFLLPLIKLKPNSLGETTWDGECKAESMHVHMLIQIIHAVFIFVGEQTSSATSAHESLTRSSLHVRRA